VVLVVGLVLMLVLVLVLVLLLRHEPAEPHTLRRFTLDLGFNGSQALTCEQTAISNNSDTAGTTITVIVR
jgi:hypothetical protein